MSRPTKRTTAAFLSLLFIAAACASPAEPPVATATTAPAGVTAPGDGADDDGAAAEPRVIEIEATRSVEFTQGGQRITDIPVTPGETVIFRVSNSAGFPHNFTIGTDAELSVVNAGGQASTLAWQSGVQELEWTVPDDVTGLKFGCTVRGHYGNMQGTFSVAG